MVLLGLMGMASTAGLNALAHSVTFGINLAVFTNLIQYMYVDTKRRRLAVEPRWRRWGPLYCVTGATVGVMADLVRHLINDANNWGLVAESGDKFKFHLAECMYVVDTIGGSSECPDLGVGPVQVFEENALGIEMSMFNDDGSLSVYGWLFTVVGTWAGFGLLFVGIFWYADLGKKLRRQFAQLRGTDVRNEEVQQAFLSPDRGVSTPGRDDESAGGFLTPLSEARSSYVSPRNART